MDELPILAAVLINREAYDRLAGKLDPNDFSEYGQLVLKCAVQFYKRDPAATSVDRDVLAAQIRRLFPSPKQAGVALDYLATVPSEVSTSNVVAEYRLLRRRRIGLDLAGALGDKEPDDEHIDRLIDKYREYSLEAVGESLRPTLEEIRERSGKRIKLSPGILNDELNGGLLRGDHIVVIGRPNAGKTMFAINVSSAVLKQGYKVLYVCNEESRERYLPRFISRLANGAATWQEIEDDPAGAGRAAERIALSNGLNNLVLLHEPSGKLAVLEGLVRIHKPDFLVVDQMRNLKAGNTNRVLELEEVAREIRRLAATYKLVAVSLTQAGDSAEDELHLNMSHVEWSRTGIQGACDLIIGIGSNPQYRAHNRRMVCGIKSKIGPRDFRYVMFLEPEYNLYRAKPRRKG